MKRSTTLCLAIAWAGAVSMMTGLVAAPLGVSGAQPIALSSLSPMLPTAKFGTPPGPPPTPRASGKDLASTMRIAARTSPRTPPAAVRRGGSSASTPRSYSAQPPSPKPFPMSSRVSPIRGNFIQIGKWVEPIKVARGSQAAIDACGPAVVWFGDLPTRSKGFAWIAGHNDCGFAFWNTLARGTVITIHDAVGTFRYRVTSRTYLPQQGGSATGLLHDDLLLQTCLGKGTGFTYADRIS